MNNNEVIKCLNCNCENSINSKFCSNCGHELKSEEEKVILKPQVNQTYTSRESSSTADKYVYNFVQENIPYYKEKFTIMKKTNNNISWNWSSFFLGAYWALYRKMYAIAVAIFCAVFILSFVPFLGAISWLGYHILMGMYGNYIYLTFINKKLEEVNYLSSEERSSAISRKGGVNILIPILVIAIPIIICLILLSIFGSILGSMMYYYF
ncbi:MULTISPECIES: DUF2628 domain-containing protein [unclassified Romboutsia]|uniref:DUF2628 domain-containing protein n=1 Tax=unclassified Romboutsia TaxID=2626894 RepID=UPI00082058C0|nr:MULTISPECIES: DUF2628 domain-containing protein [unclassified Romboutsia]SCI14020.1 Protein of uncharacterised function (DUF2628) [uncultured Clostridium sp.]